MPSVINRVPPGLLSVLDIKAQGENPRFLGDQVTPTLDFWPLYELQKAVPKASAIVGAAFGLRAELTVPANEYWHVLHMSGSPSALGAGDSYSICCYLFGSLTVGAYFEGPVGPYVGSAAPVAGELNRCYADRDFWAGPGDLIGVHCGVYAGAWSIQTRALVVPYPL